MPSFDGKNQKFSEPELSWNSATKEGARNQHDTGYLGRLLNRSAESTVTGSGKALAYSVVNSRLCPACAPVSLPWTEQALVGLRSIRLTQ